MVKSKKSKNVITVNWDEEEGGKFLRNPGEYIVKATLAEQDEDDEGKSFVKWTFQVVDGKSKGATISTRTYITPKALWKFRELLQCMNIEIGNSVQDIDLDEVVETGSKFVIEVEEGQERADGNGYYMQVSDFMSLADYKETSTTEEEEDTEEEDTEAEKEEPVSKSSKKSEKTSKKSKKSKQSEEEALDKMEEEIDELGLDIDLDDYDTFEEKKKAFEKAKSQMEEDSEEIIEKELMIALDEAIKSFIDMREKEGSKIKQDFEKRIKVISEKVEKISNISAGLVEEYIVKLETRIKELLKTDVVDEARLAQEIVIYSDKCSIEEELTRLSSHINQFSKLIKESSPIGKKLDFLIQEINRETNTIGSKANCLEITNRVIEIKTEIENIREQVQNIE